MTDQNPESPDRAVPPMAPPPGGYAPPPAAPGYPAAPAYSSGQTVAPPPGADYPGKTLGIVGLILAFVMQLAGLICCIIALNQSKRAGYKNTPAFVGLILNIVFIALSLIALVLVFAVFLPAFYTACTTGQIDCSTGSAS